MPARRPAGRILYLDILRSASVFMVVVLHASCRVLLSCNPGEVPWNVANAFDSCTRWCVPVFVMISGALFLDRDITHGRLFSKYVFRLFRVFVVWSLFYAVLDAVRALRHDVPFSPDMFVRHLLLGHYHLWFLYMMAGLYVLVPFLRAIVRDARLTLRFLWIGAVFAFLLPEAASIAEQACPRWGDILPAILGKTCLNFFLGYPVYFVLGHALAGREGTERNGQVAALCILGILCVLATAVLTSWMSLRSGKLDETFGGAGNMTVFLPAMAVFVLCKRLFAGEGRSGKLATCAGWLSRHVFGIFLVHAFVLEFLEGVVGLWALSFNPLLAIPATSVAAFLLSLFLAWLLGRLPVVGKWLV